jgi:predicted transcriptional regulator
MTASNDQTQGDGGGVFLKRLELLCSRNGGKPSFAKKAGIPYRTLIRYFSESDPSRANLVKIALAGEVSVDWLCGLEHSASGAHPDDKTAPGRPSPTLRIPTRNRGTCSIRMGRRLREIVDSEKAVEDLAHASMISREDLEEILDGNEPTLEELVRLSRTIKISIDDLLSGTHLREIRSPVSE